MRLLQQCIIFLVILASFQILFLATVWHSLSATEQQLKEARYVALRAGKSTALLRGIQDWFVSLLTVSTMPKSPLQKHLQTISRELPNEFRALCEVTKDHKKDHELAVEAQENYAFIKQDMAEAATAMTRQPDLATVVMMRDQIILGGLGRLGDIAGSLVKMTERQTHSDTLVKLERERQQKLRLILFGCVVLTVVGCSIIVVSFSRRVTRRLAQIIENFQHFEQGRQLTAAQIGSDEIVEVDRSFRWLAQRISEASEKEKAIFINLPAGLIICAEDGTIESLNPCAQHLLGKDVSELSGTKIRELLSPIEDQIPADSAPYIIPPAGTYLLRSSKEPIPIELTVSSYTIRNSQKNLLAIVDITQKREIELMKREFVSIVSHDLRTPLTSIKACLALMKMRDELSDKSLRSLELVESESERLLRLTSNLLDLARAESGKVVLNREVISSAAIVEQAIAAVSSLATKMDIDIKDESVDVLLNVDPDKICQILVNFLSNAIKYSEPRTQVRIAISEDPTSLKFSVIDQGRGIPEDVLPQVFDRFKQVYGEDAKKGTGLGLAICRLLAECHDGTVGVTSSLGGGSTFYLSLPLCVKVDEAQMSDCC